MKVVGDPIDISKYDKGVKEWPTSPFSKLHPYFNLLDHDKFKLMPKYDLWLKQRGVVGE